MTAELIGRSQANGAAGLSGMRERVNDLGGNFQIHSDGDGNNRFDPIESKDIRCGT
jgi:glucose-6-phosphate-specific signal transduction histidine kinase